MPYNPGVQDRSGEILAGGIRNSFDAIGGAITGIAKQKEEAKQITSQNKAIETLLKTGAPQLGIPAEEIDKLLATSPDESPRDRNVRLTTTLQGAMTTRELKSRELQDRAARMQIAGEIQRQGRQAQGARALIGAMQGGVFNLDAYLQGGGDDAQLIEALSRASSPGKPMPGSRGFDKVTTAAGDLLQDLATGETVDPSKIIKPAAAPKSYPGGVEYSKDGKFFRSGPDDEWKAAPVGHSRDAADISFDTNLDVAMQKLDEFEGTVKKYGNFETAQLGNDKAKATLDQLPYQLAILTAKVVDPSSVAREGEVAAAQKYLIPAGFFTTNKTTLAAIDNMRSTFKQYRTARDEAKGGAASKPAPAAAAPGEIATFNSAAEVQEAAAAGTVKKGSMVRVGGNLFRVQ
jgi:hypothetical protein